MDQIVRKATKGHVIKEQQQKNWGEEDDQGTFTEQVTDVSTESGQAL